MVTPLEMLVTIVIVFATIAVLAWIMEREIIEATTELEEQHNALWLRVGKLEDRADLADLKEKLASVEEEIADAFDQREAALEACEERLNDWRIAEESSGFGEPWNDDLNPQ